jgi:hypothetical protein
MFSLLRTEGFFCSLEILYGSLRISKLQVFDPKNIKKSFTAKHFFAIFCHQNHGFGTGSGSQLEKMPDLDYINADSQP